jgi:hypothetical protein
MVTTTIPVEGTFDIAKGRSSLRTHIAIHRWPPVFGAHASAALTAIGELILALNSNRIILIKMGVIADGDDQGIVFELALPLLDANIPRLDEALARVERATDDLDIRETANSVQISAHILVKKRILA